MLKRITARIPVLTLPEPPDLRIWEWVLLGAILVYGVGLRSWQIGQSPLWVDEAETSINALTILEHGVPVDHYLGLPIFENTFTKPWPESKKYEFRDTSYSDKGVAIYHGWLPLYMVAGAFWVAGIEPDTEQTDPRVRHSVEEMVRRTAIARTPAVLFGAVFLLGIFVTARRLFGNDAAWAALVAATVSTSTVNLARHARYYSFTLAATVLCCLMICMMLTRGRWRDFIAGAVLFVLLFHTNLLSFVIVLATAGLMAPFLPHHRHIFAKLGIFAGILAVGIVPWVWLTGFLTSAFDRPMARSLLSLSHILEYPMDRLTFVLLAMAALIWLLAVRRLGGAVPRRILQPFVAHPWPFFFLASWVAIGFVAFNYLIPAASYFHSRLTLVILVPALLFGALLFSAIARTFFPRHSSLLGIALFLAVLHFGDKATFRWPSMDSEMPHLFTLIEHLDRLEIQPGSHLYADGGYNLILRFYTGMPFQNSMPVRKSYFDYCGRESLILEGPRYESLGPGEIQRIVRQEEGRELSALEARRLARAYSGFLVRKELTDRVARISPPDVEVPDESARLASHQRRKTSRAMVRLIEESGNLLVRGFEPHDHRTFWELFFYRFVNPEERLGGANYAGRIREAHAILMPGEWVAIHSPARPGHSREGYGSLPCRSATGQTFLRARRLGVVDAVDPGVTARKSPVRG